MARRCSYCYNTGHNRRTCPQIKKAIEADPESYTARRESRRRNSYSERRCSYCEETGHNRRTCPTLAKHKSTALDKNRAFRKDLLERMLSVGFGEGALVETTAYDIYSYVRNAEGELESPSYSDQESQPVLGIVTRINWGAANYRGAGDEFARITWLNAFNRNGGQAVTHVSVDGDRLDTVLAMVKSPVPAGRVEATKPYGWERSAPGDVNHVFEDAKAHYFRD